MIQLLRQSLQVCHSSMIWFLQFWESGMIYRRIDSCIFHKWICQLTRENNFQSIWKKQVLLVVRGFNFEGSLLDRLLLPPVLDDFKGNKVVNPEYSKFSPGQFPCAPNTCFHIISDQRRYSCWMHYYYVYLNKASSKFLVFIYNTHYELVWSR